jgi:small subunit ribosomal protein S17
MANSIGIDVQQPKKACQDDNCPFHGQIKVRGRQHTGTVVSTKMRRSAVVQWEHRHLIPKYERYERRLTKITVHAPDCLDVKEGDMVQIAETRPLSKTKNFVIIQNLGREKGYALKKEGREAGKAVKKEKEEETEEKQ